MAYLKAGMGKQATEAFTKVLKLEPDSADAHVDLGISLADQYNLQGALREFSRATELSAKSAWAHYNEAKLLHDMGKREQARTEVEIGYGLAPDFPPLLYLLGLVERETGNFDASTKAFEKLVSLRPDNSAAQFFLGQNLLRQGKGDVAIKHWQAAVTADPENREALYYLSLTFSRLHDPEGKTWVRRFQEVTKGDHLSDRVESLNNFAIEAARDLDWTQAVEQLKQALQLCRNCKQLPVLHRNLGFIYARTGDTEDALRELSLALKLDPKDIDSLKAIHILESLEN